MRKSSYITIFALYIGFSHLPIANAQWPQSTDRDTQTSIEVIGKAFDRSGIDSSSAVLSDSSTSTTVLTEEQVTELGATLGLEAKVNFFDCWRNELELRTSVANWQESLTRSGAFSSTLFPTGGLDITQFDYDYESDYFSIELNRRRAVTSGVTLTLGPRFVSTSDNVLAVSDIDLAPGLFTQTNAYESKNTLVGFQGGLEFNFPVADQVYFQSYVKGGGYLNSVSYRSDVTSTLGTTTITTSDTIESFVGELGCRLQMDLLPNCVSCFVGYEGTWIDGIALSPANISFSSGPLDTTNTSFFQAITFGAQILY